MKTRSSIEYKTDNSKNIKNNTIKEQFSKNSLPVDQDTLFTDIFIEKSLETPTNAVSMLSRTSDFNEWFRKESAITSHSSLLGVTT